MTARYFIIQVKLLEALGHEINMKEVNSVNITQHCLKHSITEPVTVVELNRTYSLNDKNTSSQEDTKE